MKSSSPSRALLAKLSSAPPIVRRRGTLVVIGLGAAALALGSAASGQSTTQPAAATQPAAPSAEEVLNKMLRASGQGGGTGAQQPLPPATTPGTMTDATSGGAAVAPGAAPARVLREGDMVVNRVGRLQRGGDGQQWEFVFDADGRAMRDAPLIIVPSLKLMDMEEAVKSSRRDLRFRITGEVTEYRGRNYVLLQKVVVVPDAVQAF